MGFSHSPKIVTDNLQYYYDTGNAVRSYKGEPTENLFPYPYLTNNPDTTVNTASITQKDFGDGLIGLEMIQATTADIVSFGMNSLSTAVSGATYTWSSYVHCTSTGNKVKGQVTVRVDGVRYWLTNSNTWTTSVTECSHLFTPTVANQWHRVYTQFTMPTGTLTDFQLGSWYRNTSTFTLRVANTQLEVKSHATQFVNGTRSATQGLLDMTGNNTINLSNVSFDADADITFDGTGDIIYTGLYAGRNPSTDPFTVEAWVKSDTTSGNRMWIDATSNGSSQRFYSALIDSTTSATGIQGAGWGDSTPAHTNWSHQVIVMDGSNANCYADGVLKYQVGYTSYGIQALNIGGRGSYYWLGKISMFKLYERALSNTEVLQNYNALKSRFGL